MIRGATHIRRLRAFFRARVEGLACIGLCLVFLPRLVRLNRTHRRRILRRWREMIMRGLDLFRVSWPDILNLEKAGVVWRHIWLLECMDTLPSTISSSSVSEAESANRILFIQLGHFGDVIHMVPLLRSMKQQKPESELTLLVGPWVESLARSLPYVDHVLVYSTGFRLFNRANHPTPRWREERHWLRALRAQQFDILFSMATTNFPELLIWCAVRPSLGVGAPTPLMDFYELGPVRKVAYDVSTYEPLRACGLLHHIGLQPGDWTLDPLIKPEDRVNVSAVLAELGMGDGGRIAVLAPGAGWPGKCWPAEHYAVLARWLMEKHCCHVILVGSLSENEWLHGISHNSGHAIPVLAGSLSWGGLSALIERSCLFVGNDSAPLHLAAACGTPAVAFFGPTLSRHWMPPGRACQMALQADYNCSGCIPWHVDAKCLHDRACMWSISVNQAMEAVDHVLHVASDVEPCQR